MHQNNTQSTFTVVAIYYAITVHDIYTNDTNHTVCPHP